jgi:hypothetical protein
MSDQLRAAIANLDPEQRDALLAELRAVHHKLDSIDAMLVVLIRARRRELERQVAAGIPGTAEDLAELMHDLQQLERGEVFR